MVTNWSTKCKNLFNFDTPLRSVPIASHFGSRINIFVPLNLVGGRVFCIRFKHIPLAINSNAKLEICWKLFNKMFGEFSIFSKLTLGFLEPELLLF